MKPRGRGEQEKTKVKPTKGSEDLETTELPGTALHWRGKKKKRKKTQGCKRPTRRSGKNSQKEG